MRAMPGVLQSGATDRRILRSVPVTRRGQAPPPIGEVLRMSVPGRLARRPRHADLLEQRPPPGPEIGACCRLGDHRGAARRGQARVGWPGERTLRRRVARNGSAWRRRGRPGVRCQLALGWRAAGHVLGRRGTRRPRQTRKLSIISSGPGHGISGFAGSRSVMPCSSDHSWNARNGPGLRASVEATLDRGNQRGERARARVRAPAVGTQLLGPGGPGRRLGRARSQSGRSRSPRRCAPAPGGRGSSGTPPAA
jgi:hypothetical protein